MDATLFRWIIGQIGIFQLVIEKMVALAQKKLYDPLALGKFSAGLSRSCRPALRQAGGAGWSCPQTCPGRKTDPRKYHSASQDRKTPGGWGAALCSRYWQGNAGKYRGRCWPCYGSRPSFSGLLLWLPLTMAFSFICIHFTVPFSFWICLYNSHSEGK